MANGSDTARRELRARRLHSQRLPGARFAAVADAASGMRGTLMLMAASDVHWLTTLCAPRSLAASTGPWRAAGLVPEDFARAADVVAGALAGGSALSRTALLSALDAAGVATGEGRGSHVLRYLAGTALIVFGPPRGREQTFALLDERVPAARRLTHEEALAELARRYLAGHGPATVRDLAWWSGLPLADARRAAALAGDGVEEVSIGVPTATARCEGAPAPGGCRAGPTVAGVGPMDTVLVAGAGAVWQPSHPRGPRRRAARRRARRDDGDLAGAAMANGPSRRATWWAATVRTAGCGRRWAGSDGRHCWDSGGFAPWRPTARQSSPMSSMRTAEAQSWRRDDGVRPVPHGRQQHLRTTARPDRNTSPRGAGHPSQPQVNVAKRRQPGHELTHPHEPRAGDSAYPG